MKVFVPSQKDGNPFFDEIMFYSKIEFCFKSFKKYNRSYKVVLIHWPELIFNWKEPTTNELEALAYSISIWKQHAKIVYVVHNLERHFGMSPKFSRLYDLIETSCDAMIHFGNYSSDLFKNKFPNTIHKVIPHPLYERFFKQYDKVVARKKLGIDLEALVVIAPGAIRHISERKMLIKAFKKLPQKNKVLLATNMLRFEFPWEFKGRVRLKSVIDIKNVYEERLHSKKYSKPTYYFNYDYLENNKFSLMMSAADIVFIPRIKILNSGNVFLGLTYKKIIVGPNLGNVKEVLETFSFPGFDSNNPKDVYKALYKAVRIFDSEKYSYNIESLNLFKPKNIAIQWDFFLEEMNI